MEKQLRKEIRKILSGRTIRDEEGWLIAVPEGYQSLYQGVTDSTGYRKIKVKGKRRIRVAENNADAFFAVLNTLQEVGELVNLQEKPDALCALCRVLLTRRVLLCVEPEEGGSVLVQAYVGRSITSWICCRKVISKFVSKLEESQGRAHGE